MTDLRKMSNDALVALALDYALRFGQGRTGNRARIMEAQSEILHRLAGAAPSEGMEPESEINWQGLYQRTEDALLALRVELGGKDYKTHAIDHVAAPGSVLQAPCNANSLNRAGGNHEQE